MIATLGLITFAVTQGREFVEKWKGFWNDSGEPKEIGVRPELDTECSRYAAKVGHNRTLYGDPQSQRYFLEDYTRCMDSKTKVAQESDELAPKNNMEKGLELFAAPEEFTQ